MHCVILSLIIKHYKLYNSLSLDVACIQSVKVFLVFLKQILYELQRTAYREPYQGALQCTCSRDERNYLKMDHGSHVSLSNVILIMHAPDLSHQAQC